TLADVEITPALERPRAELHDQMPLGAYAKAVLVYPTRWWAERGLSGIAFSDQGLVQMTVDAGHPGGPATMAAFVTGDAARSLSPDPDARRAQMLDAVVDLWGPDAAEPSAYQDHDWSTDAWARGGPVGLMGPGTLTQLGTHLHPPTGRIHWAGTERSPQFTGYIEGAIVAGEAAADAILHDAPPSAAAGALEQAIEVSTVLPATPEEVWAIIDDTSRYAEWADSVIEVVEHHGSARVGETYVEKTTTVGPLTAQTTWTVRESGDHWRRDTGEGLPMLSGVAVSFHTRATDEANATRLTYRFTCTTPSRRSRLAFRALRGAIRKDLEHSLEALRTLLA
ncbi:MAG: FAD-dependent oxidoreductase, partial [Acidimicrobiales bacterium]|nr:FAD-dependent oxidoreductase [Acidimicrobiales bacterium]